MNRPGAEGEAEHLEASLKSAGFAKATMAHWEKTSELHNMIDIFVDVLVIRACSLLMVCLMAHASLGALDAGQAAVVANGRALALEGAEGTAAMLERVTGLRSAGRVSDKGGVLVKTMKPGQDTRFDLPTIGVDTVIQARAAGLNAIGVEAEVTLMLERNAIIEVADDARIALFGFAQSRSSRQMHSTGDLNG